VVNEVKLSFKVITPGQEIENKILNAITKSLSGALAKVESKLQSQFIKLTTSALLGAPEIQSIRGGTLFAEFGDPEAPQKIANVVSIIANSWQFQLTPLRKTQNQVKGELRAVLSVDISSIAALGAYQTEKGTNIPWLEWLLTLGDRIIVLDHEVTFDNPQSSRTGAATMKAGSGWRVPPEFSGTADDNFITRSVGDVLNEISQIIRKELGAAI
jgi:hypothetical protein